MIQHICATAADLHDAGMSRRAIARAVASGALVRPRRDRYLTPDTPAAIVEAVRVGGRITCLSLLALLGVFVFSNPGTHVHMMRGASRLRSPESAKSRLERRPERRARLHWMPLIRADRATSVHVSIVDAVAHAILCQPARHAVATIDSALNRGLLRASELVQVFSALPAKYAVLQPLIDGRAESGTETLVRLMARTAGYRVETQVVFAGIGRVDLLLDGWLVVECDSKGFHSSWEQQQRDRDRDLSMAMLGYVTFRPTAQQILYRPEEVAAALRALRVARRRVRA